ncbi:TonB-dependent receptor [Lichenicoccus roseus]|uniref:TonB-dependent receptor n=1 Tax=Lichenicoccus roseus TaxID=2683649 RepID=A0A5R9JDF8_9PROT|nr:TonB-dependent receptor [Lichenicoccus roseus]TLU74587.1 TonB-dependent receptor [Lichenicoccus roseus]
MAGLSKTLGVFGPVMLLAIPTSGPASAQTAATPPAQTQPAGPAGRGAPNHATPPGKTKAGAAQPSQLEEIVVTSNKRRQNSRKIAGSIGVISGKELIDHHVESYEDITRVLPGVSFASHNGPGQDNISIRGVSSTVGNPTVGIYIDEVPIITQNGYEGAAQPRILDLDRVEVLRGPQGTLYGASSEGGTIRFITNQPNLDKFSAIINSDVSGTVHGGPNSDQQFAVNLPVIPDKFALRISGELLDNSGWINNESLAGNLVKSGTNYERTGAVRVTGLIQLAPDFSLTPSFFYQNLFTGDSPNFFENLGTYNQNKQVREFIKDEIYIPSLTIHKGIGNFADLTSITSYFQRDVDRQADGTYFNSTALSQFYLDPSYPQYQPQNDSILGNSPSPVLFQDHFQTITQEVRLASKADQRLRWVLGFFYSDQQWTHFDYETISDYDQEFQNIYGFNINQSVLGSPGNPGLWNNNLVWQVYDHNDITQYAGFGQIDYDLTPRLHLSAGERYVYAHETFSEVGGGFFDLGGAGTMGSPYRQSASFSAPTPKFSATYDLSVHTSVYSTIAKGFRLGGATTPNTNVSCVAGLNQLGFNNAPNTYGSDQLWSYEAGLKSLLLHNTLSINVAGYYIDWSRIQQTITIPICGGAFNYNVGNAEAYGGEIETRYRPPAIPGLTLGVNAGAEHASITSTINAQTAAVGENVLFTPTWSASAIADYYHDLSAAVTGFIKADYDWVGPSNGSFTVTDPNFHDPAYGVLNASVGVDFRGWEASLYAQNLLDNKIIIQRPIINSVTEAYTLRPATIGVHLTKRF